MNNILISMQIHSINASFCSNDIFMEKTVNKKDAQILKDLFAQEPVFNFRGEEVVDGVLGFYFEDNTHGIDYRVDATEEEMNVRKEYFTNLGFSIPDYKSCDEPVKEAPTDEKIIELLEDVNRELIEGWTFKCYSLSDLIDLIYCDGDLINLPENDKEDDIKYYCEDLLKQFDEGMDGIREVEGLVECLYDVLGLENPAY